MSLADSAAKTLAKLGEPITFVIPAGEAEINPATGDIIGTPSPEQTFPGFGYPGRYVAGDIDGTTILATDIRLTASRVSQRPERGMRCLVDSQDFRVQDVRPVRFSGDDVVYICQLRAG